MKYIRTKDGRISYLSSEPYEDMDCYEIITSKGTITYRREDEVIKIANTIEELCDEFVCRLKEIPTTWCSFDLDEIEEGLRTHSLKEWEWFGMIWTEKGLIYVAKMNDKGELELL